MRDGRTGVQVRHAFLRSSSGPRSNPPFRFLPTVIKGIAIEANVSVMNFDITDDDVHSLRVVSRRMAGKAPIACSRECLISTDSPLRDSTTQCSAMSHLHLRSHWRIPHQVIISADASYCDRKRLARSDQFHGPKLVSLQVAMDPWSWT